MEPFELVTELTPQHQLELHTLFQKEWWTVGRSFDDMSFLLEHSMPLAFIHTQSNTLVAFLRVVTDYRYFAYIMDVVVDEAYRRQNLGTKLIQAILTVPELAQVKKFELRCLPELESFYGKCGFGPAPKELLHLHHVRFTKP